MSRLNVLIIAVILILTAGLTYMLDHQSMQAPAFVPAPAPAFELTDIDGQTHLLSDFEGKIILLHFWATWCAPCIVELPELFELAQRDADKLVLLAVSIDDNLQDIDRFLNKTGLEAPGSSIVIGHDPDRQISEALYETVKLPETFFISADGKIVDKVIGAYEGWTSRKMQKRIQKISVKNEH